MSEPKDEDKDAEPDCDNCPDYPDCPDQYEGYLS